MSKERTIRDLKDELMIYEPDADLIHFLNPTARRIYELFQLGKDHRSIERTIRKEFQVPEGRDVQADIRRCLEELKKKDLLEG